MRAVVFYGFGNVQIDEVPEPQLQAPTDAIVRLTASAICGTDLHMVRGTMSGMKRGTVLGHEGVGYVETVGPGVHNIRPGDRVVVCSTIACGSCIYCHHEEYASCENANPNGTQAGTAFFGGPQLSGPFNGLQAERARIPYADTVLVKLPDSISDDDAILVSDIFPTGYMAAEIADVRPGDFVAVFGCGPVGQMAIASAKMLGADKVFGIDVCPDRLELAKRQGAIPINYEKEDPIKVLRDQTNGYGPDACIDAVGVDAFRPHAGPAKEKNPLGALEGLMEQKTVAPLAAMLPGDQWRAGDGPSQVLDWCVDAVRKSGVISIVGVYPDNVKFFKIGTAMQKCLTIRAANCSHRKYVPKLLQIIEDTGFKPSQILTVKEVLDEAVSCYKHFDKRDPGWTKVELLPAQSSSDGKRSSNGNGSKRSGNGNGGMPAQ